MGFHRPSTGRVREKEKMVRNKVKKGFLHICNLPKTIYRRRNIQFITSLSFTLVALVSMLFMGIAFYAQFVRNARQMALENNKQMLEQVSWNLNSYIRNMMNISDFMYYNVIKNKDLTEESIDKEMNLLYEENKDYLVSIVCVTEDGAVLAAGPIATRKKSVDLKEQEWFVQAGEKIENLHFTTPHVQNIFESSNYQYAWVISLSRSVELTNVGHTRRGVLLVDMNYSAIEQVFDKANEQNSGYVYLMDRNGEIIYHPKQKAIYSGMMKENNRMAASYEDGTHVENFMGEERAVVVKTIGYTGWKIVNVTPTSELFRNTIHIGFFMVMICTVTIFLILFGNIFISDRVTEPLRNLEDSIRYLEEGHLEEEHIYIGGSHEIRHLGQTITLMVKRMKDLMDKMVREQEDKRKSELDALQSQINPHFLYNTLDSVVWMVECEQYREAISMVKALAKLFRISLSKGNSIITIEDELTHAQNYMSIQQMLYRNKFCVKIDVEPAIRGCITIKLIVQPILENAIYHGMEFMDGEGEITVHGYEKDGDIYIEVSDNGMGIPEETIESLLTDKSRARGKGSGIGLWNVNQRIALYFKGDYGLSIKSELDEGTTVTIHLPKILYEDYRREEGAQ